MTSMPRQPVYPPSDHVLTSALPRLPVTVDITDHAYIHTPPHSQLRTLSRSPPQPACTQSTLTSALPRQPANTLVPPPDDVLISALPRPLTLVGPPSRDDVVTSALPRPLTAAADFAYTMQRPADSVDTSNVCTYSVEPWLAEFPPPLHVCRQPTVPLLSEHMQTTASDYVNQDPVPVLSAHRYANTPFDSNYQNISANMSLPPLSTHTNVPTHINVPLSQAVTLGQSNVTQPSMVAFPPSVCTSYVDNSQRLPIAVDQPRFSAFSRTDVHHSRPAVADSTVQYAICTSATADHVRPTVTAQTATLQSPSVHWRKQLAYDYVQPDTGLSAPIHAAPAIHSGYIRPQTSDTHTHTSK